MNHLTEHELSAHLDHALKGRALEQAEAHLASCAACRDALARLASQDQALRPALAHDPGEAYFESFAARVEDRIRAAGMRGAQSRVEPVPGGWLSGWLRSPRRVAWLGATAALIVGVAVVLLTAREVTPPTTRDELERELARRAPAERTEAPTSPPATTGSAQGAAVQPPDLRSKREAPRAVAPPENMTRRNAPARLQEVRRERGEEVPVSPSMPGFAQEPPAAPAPASQPGHARVRRPGATPMQSGTAPAREDMAMQAESSATAAPPTGSTWGSLKGLRDLRAGAVREEQSETRFCGTVRDDRGRPVVGAEVVVTDRARVVTTDSRGQFCLEAPAGEHELTVMAVGFGPSRQQIVVGGEMTEVSVVIKPVAVMGGQPSTRFSGPPLKEAKSNEGPLALDRKARDEFSGLGDEARMTVRNAQWFDIQAKRHGTAARFDAAAAEWERALLNLRGAPLERAARSRLAEARYRAWRAGPNPARNRAAVEAIVAYLATGPSTRDRDRATRWLEELRR